MRCDGRPQCEDGSDEFNCAPTCQAGQFRCDVRRCIDERRVCDRRFDCSDRTDEANCPTERPIVVTAQPSAITLREGREAVFQCSATGGSQVPPVRWSRGNVLGPLRVHPLVLVAPENLCARMVSVFHQILDVMVSQIVQMHPMKLVVRRNHTIDIHIINLKLCTDSPCEPNEFRCNNGLCAMKIWRCDGDRDCTDGSDEFNCRENHYFKNLTHKLSVKKETHVSHDEYQCVSGDQCVPASYQCDNENDCQDRSDEIGCCECQIIELRNI
ncbi:hypothetical protein KUTeg_002068 [Tegillarca granosa]|uniref:Ig-like domain-containing protein n=1 Tax=Tegillarca granosa TaxID=220873 RepID=A0ABQ9FTA3_TEGGR|nr:hypothetical protein KUTeg_002068 [Tegillarca granosa]